jgi:hypothetical protein
LGAAAAALAAGFVAGADFLVAAGFVTAGFVTAGFVTAGFVAGAAHVADARPIEHRVTVINASFFCIRTRR